MLACQADFHSSSGGARQGAGPAPTDCDLPVGLLQALLQPRMMSIPEYSQDSLAGHKGLQGEWKWEPRSGGA